MTSLRYIQPPDSDPISRLEDLGFNLLDLQEILEAGLSKRFEASPLHPVGAAAQFEFIETCANMSQLLGLKGWKIVDEDNMRIMVRPDGKVALSTASGESGVGLAGVDPAKRTVGNKTAMAATVNGLIQMRIELFGSTPTNPNENRPPDRAHWFLLYYFDDKKNELRSEVSRPIEIDTSKTMTWAERIILAPIKLGDGPKPDRIFEETEDDDGDFEITRRVG